MRKLIFALILGSFCFNSTPVAAYHLVGGELTYECQGNNDYLIRLKIFRDCYCTNCAQYDNPAYVFIYNVSGVLLQSLSLTFPGSVQLPVYINNPCLAIPPDVCVEEAVYTATVNLPPISGGYHLVYQRCCRNSTILNIVGPSSTGATYYSVIPDPGIVLCNSSPYFNNFPPIALCAGDTLTFDHSATDIDGDSLVYELCAPYVGASNNAPMPTPGSPPPPPPPPFVTFAPPYSATAPFNGAPQLTINSQTGELYGAPTTVGQFVVGVCVKEYRNGVLLSTNKRDFQFNVVNCDAIITASLPNYILECDDLSVLFQNNSSGGTFYEWDFGDGVYSTEVSPTHVYPDTGVYFAVLIANPGWPCADTAYSTVNVYPGMTANYEYITACADSDLFFTDLSVSINGDITNWNWNFGDGNVSQSQNSEHAYTTGGYYSVTLTTINDKGCVDVTFQNIYVYPKPQIDFSTAEPCVNNSIDFDNLTTLDSGSVVSWLWDMGGLYSDSTEDISYYFDSVGFYDVTLSAVSSFGCINTYTQTIYIKPLPISEAGPDTIICSGDAITIGTSVLSGHTYDWTPLTGLSNPFVSAPTVSVINDTTFVVSTNYVVTTTYDGCTSTDNVSIGVFPEISASIPYQSEQCFPDNKFFFDANGVYGPNATFEWDFGDGVGVSISDTVSYSYSDTGSFNVTLTIRDNDCESTTSIITKVYDVPIATFDFESQVGCKPFTVVFNAWSQGGNIADSQLVYIWDFGDGDSAFTQTTSHTYDPEGTYIPSLTIKLGVCEGYEEMTKYDTVTVLPSPTAGIIVNPNQGSIYNPIINIIDVSDGADDCYLVVVPGDTLEFCDYEHNYFDPTLPYDETVSYDITQIVTNSYGCSDTITVSIDILPEYIFFAPNCFTPNQDGMNELFLGKGYGIIDFEMYIYDRWGDMVFKTNSLKEGWDGRVNGGKEKAQQDVYVYIVNIVDIYQKQHKVVGRVSLID